jgi:hypothetical protein
MHSPTRRDLMRYLICVSVPLAFPVSAFAWPSSDSIPPLGARLKRFFSNKESARVIGKRYLTMRPEESSLNRLTALICRTPESYDQLAKTDTNTLRILLAEQQRDDFTNGRVMLVDGWILSETEVHLCAIASLSS